MSFYRKQYHEMRQAKQKARESFQQNFNLLFE